MTLPTNPTLCILGCGTMGRAILSGILDSSNVTTANETPTFIPKKFIACVSGEESAQRIIEAFNDKITILVKNNVEGVKESDIVLLWYLRNFTYYQMN